jgi:hypothetical protein
MQSVLPKNVHGYGPVTCDIVLHRSRSLMRASKSTVESYMPNCKKIKLHLYTGEVNRCYLLFRSEAIMRAWSGERGVGILRVGSKN